MDIVHPRKFIIYNMGVTKRSSLTLNSSVTSVSTLLADRVSAENALDTFVSNVYNTFINDYSDISLDENTKSVKDQVGTISKSKKYSFHGPRIIDIPNPSQP